MNLEAISFIIIMFNSVRSSVGMSQLKINYSLKKAAEWHWKYMVINRELGHYESYIRKGFSGRKPIDRALRAGYPKTNSCVGEVLSYLKPAIRNSELLSAYCQLNSVYHRGIVLDPDFDEMGVAAGKGYMVALLGTRKYFSHRRYPGRKREIFFYPYDGQKDFFVSFDSDAEEPDPIKGASVVGPPISVHFSYYEVQKIKRKFRSFFDYQSSIRFSLKEKGSSSEIPFYRVVEDKSVYFVPRKPLKAGTDYVAEFDFPDGYSWKIHFETAPKPEFATIKTSRPRGTVYVPFTPFVDVLDKATVVEYRYITYSNCSKKPVVDEAYVLRTKKNTRKIYLRISYEVPDPVVELEIKVFWLKEPVLLYKNYYK